LDSTLGGCRTCVINNLFFKLIWKIKTGRFKTNLTLSLILRFNLRLGGYSIWSASFIAPHIKEDYSRHEHLTALRQPRKYLKDTFKMEFQQNSKTLSEVLGSLQYSSTKSSGACLRTWHRLCRIRDGACTITYTCCKLLEHE
jgi:hypothetical protein